MEPGHSPSLHPSAKGQSGCGPTAPPTSRAACALLPAPCAPLPVPWPEARSPQVLSSQAGPRAGQPPAQERDPFPHPLPKGGLQSQAPERGRGRGGSASGIEGTGTRWVTPGGLWPRVLGGEKGEEMPAKAPQERNSPQGPRGSPPRVLRHLCGWPRIGGAHVCSRGGGLPRDQPVRGSHLGGLQIGVQALPRDGCPQGTMARGTGWALQGGGHLSGPCPPALCLPAARGPRQAPPRVHPGLWGSGPGLAPGQGGRLHCLEGHTHLL